MTLGKTEVSTLFFTITGSLLLDYSASILLVSLKSIIDFKKYIEIDINDEVEKLIKTCEENLKSN